MSIDLVERESVRLASDLSTAVVPSPTTSRDLEVEYLAYGLESRPTRLIVTTAIGGTYFEDWSTSALATWVRYADAVGAGIVAFTSRLVEEGPDRKRAAWDKFLAPTVACSIAIEAEEILLLDTDILISPLAEDVFDRHRPGRVSAVSSIDVPFDIDFARRRLAHLRHTCISSTYPLDSSLFSNAHDEFERRGLPPQPDYFCAGMLVIDADPHAAMLVDWYREVSREEAEAVQHSTGQWEEPYLNARIQSEVGVNWLPYHFQAMWTYECAVNHPYVFQWLRDDGRRDDVRAVIEAVLMRVSFLHFAGSWPEARVWTIGAYFEGRRAEEAKEFAEYLSRPLLGRPVGKVLPPDDWMDERPDPLRGVP